jgi:hypothetical protein
MRVSLAVRRALARSLRDSACTDAQAEGRCSELLLSAASTEPSHSC